MARVIGQAKNGNHYILLQGLGLVHEAAAKRLRNIFTAPNWPLLTHILSLSFFLHALLLTHLKGNQEADSGPGSLRAPPMVE